MNIRTLSGLAPLLVGAFVLTSCSEDTVTSNSIVDPDHPRVVSAVSTGTSEVIVTFSNQLAGGMDSAENPNHYQIVGADPSGAGDSPYLVVTGCDLYPDGKAVKLTTMSQSDIRYLLTVTNVHDVYGRSIAGATSTDNPATAYFVGTAPTIVTDSDGDGITDSAEQRGWDITILLVNGEGQRRHVTSDPVNADTDADGIGDAKEKEFGIDPRSTDTDTDELTDYQELAEIYSDPARQDTDADGLTDGLEFNFLKLSPSLADTDGDQISDADEVQLGNRNPRVADLPLPGIEIGDTDLRLDVRFKAISTRGTRNLETKGVSTSLQQTDTRAFSNMDKSTNTFLARVAIEQSWEVSGEIGGTIGGKVGGKYSFETGYTGEWTSQFTEETSQQSQQAYEESTTTAAEITEDETVSREVIGASLKATLNLRSLGDISFTVRNLQISVFLQDPRNPSQVLPIATLVPDPTAGTPNEFNLGPLVPVRGPFVFSNDQIFPSLVEDLMRDPRGLIYKIANYDITDELGRNFAYTSQEINDRTGALIIDYGGADIDGDGEGETTERLRISTSAGRPLSDTDNDGDVDDQDRRVVFDPEGQHVGITVHEALEGALGLVRYDEAETPSSALTDAQLAASYSTRMVPVDVDGDGVVDGDVETLWRVRLVSKELANPLKSWEVLTPTGIDRTVDLGDRIVSSGEGLVFAFVQDLDGDGVPARWEYIYGCSDQSSDTDGDGLDDRLEVFEGWEVDVAGKGTFKAYGSCARDDSDRDGLTDPVEANRVVDIDTDGDGAPDLFDVPASLDAKNADTDEDAVSDFDEINGYVVKLRFDLDAANSNCMAPDPSAPRTVTCRTNPLAPDTDGDTLPEGGEVALGTDPSVHDGDKFFDDDGDGLVNFFEQQVGWTVTYYRKMLSCAEQGDPLDCIEPAYQQGEEVMYQVFSDPYEADVDGDGLIDKQERNLGTDPNRADTDGDGLSDGGEAQVTYLPGGTEEYELKTDPLDADTDDDLLKDGDEVLAPWIVRVSGNAPEQVYSDPNIPDADYDRLVDYVEFLNGTHPVNYDTDGDGVSDEIEIDPVRAFNSLPTYSSDSEPYTVRTDPLTPDKLVEMDYIYLYAAGDCEPAAYGAGNFRGRLNLQKEPGGLENTLYNIWNDLNQGQGVEISAPAHTFSIRPGELVVASGEDLLETDDVSGEVSGPERLNPFYKIFDYATTQTKTEVFSAMEPGSSDCQLDITLSVSVDIIGRRVLPPNATPVASDDYVTTNEDTFVAINVLSNDELGNEPTSITSVTQPNAGVAEISNLVDVQYQPEQGFVGTDTFAYTITDVDGEQSTATVTVDVVAPSP